MTAVFFVLKKIDLVDAIMNSLAEAGIRGGTVIDSAGMAGSIAKMNSNVAMVQLLRGILSGEDDSHKSKTIFVIVRDDRIETVKKAITAVTGELSKPNAGIMFGIPISFVDGIEDAD